METNKIKDISQLAQEIAEKLTEISLKENEIDEIKESILSLETQIKELNEKKRNLEQFVQSERFLIAERLNKPKPADVIQFKK